MRQLIRCPFDYDTDQVAQRVAKTFPPPKQVNGLSGTRAKLSCCKALDALVPGAKGLFLRDCVVRLENDPFGPTDALGIDFKDTVLKFGASDEALQRMSLQAPTNLRAELYVQSLTCTDETCTDIVGWLYAHEVVQLGEMKHKPDTYWQVQLLNCRQPMDLVKVLNARYP